MATVFQEEGPWTFHRGGGETKLIIFHLYAESAETIPEGVRYCRRLIDFNTDAALATFTYHCFHHLKRIISLFK
uniref:Uncharacterized protein n=1 Tax=Romanomermis culicivorax TaxID=13658 RepID=A0A915L9E7_ROMCU